MVFNPGVIRYVFWLGKPAEVYEKEVEALKNSLKGLLIFFFNEINKGSNYVIQNGPFKGREGKVLSTDKNKLKLELRIRFISFINYILILKYWIFYLFYCDRCGEAV